MEESIQQQLLELEALIDGEQERQRSEHLENLQRAEDERFGSYARTRRFALIFRWGSGFGSANDG
jgi:hypothetical protein